MIEIPDRISPRTRQLLQSVTMWDNHACMPLRTDPGFLPQLERYRQIGASVVSLNVGFASMSAFEHVRILASMRRWIGLRPDVYRLISSVEDVRLCKADGKLGIVFDIEGMVPVQDDLNLVQTFYELGVRWMLIAYNRNNLAGGGCLDEDGGLTATGRAIVDEMERVGMVLCLSHCGARTAADALEYSRNPVIFSHSNPGALTPHPRNISDDLMRLCARKGGVIGLGGIGSLIGKTDDPVGTLLEHLKYAVDLVGAEHVGLGLDYVFDPAELDHLVSAYPAFFLPRKEPSARLTMIPPEQILDIADGLVRASFSDDQIRGILGGNWLRIATQVWRPSGLGSPQRSGSH